MSWDKVTLGDIASNIQTGPFGSQLHQSDYSLSGTPVVMPKDLSEGRISEISIARVSDDHVNRLSRHKIEVGDILYSRRGDVGRCAYATETEKGWLCGTGCLRVTIDAEKANAKFVFYQLQKPDTVGWVEKHAIGSTMLNLNTSILSNVPVIFPSLETQERIAGILSAYDNLIENNQKQIRLLEEAARRLYKEWFVDFRFPGHESVPITDGVPQGWRKVSLTDLLEIKYGKAHQTLESGDIPAYGSGGLVRKVKPVLYSGESVLIPRKGSLNNILYVCGDFWTIDTMFYSVPLVPNVAKFAHLFLSGLDMNSFNIGAAVPSMTVNILDGMRVLLPTENVLGEFERMVSPFFERKTVLLQQIEAATEARNRLLPVLMNGGILN